MSGTPVPLLARVQGLLERTYAMRGWLGDASRFVIGDAGYRDLYAASPRAIVAGAALSPGARTLVRELDGTVRASIYYPDALIATLERHPPDRGLGDENVDAFATLVEELDHLLCLAERVGEGRPSTLFELELHANVSKHLVLERFLAGSSRRLDPRRRVWLRWHLFHKPEWREERYRDAARWGLRFLTAAGSRARTEERLSSLRRFHAAGPQGKLRIVRELEDEASA